MTVVLALLTSLMWGTADFAGGVLSKRMRVFVVIGWSTVLGFGYITAAVLVMGHAGDLTDVGPWMGWGVAAGLAGGVGAGLYYAALARGTMGVVAPVASIGVLLPVAVGLVQGEKPGVIAMLGVGVAVIGIVMASGPDLRAAGDQAVPILLAAASGLSFGFFMVALDQGAQSSELLTLWAGRASFALVFIVAAIACRTTGDVKRANIPLLLVVSVGDLAANATLAVATASGYVSIVSVLASLYPVVTLMWARIILAERLNGLQTAGAALTMGGVVAIAAA